MSFLPARSDSAGTRPALVSVVIPCYKQAHFLADAIESVTAQTYHDIEIIVVNDGSPDHTSAVARRYRGVRCVEQPNAGLAEARNRGIAESRGAFIVFLDADDRLLPDAVRTNAERLAADPRLGFVAGRSRDIDHGGRPMPLPAAPPPPREGDPHLALLRENRICMPGMVMFRRRVLDTVGPFDSRVDAVADLEMYLRVSRAAPVALHDEVVAEYRRHSDNMSLNDALMLTQVCRVLRRQRRALRTPAERAAWRDGWRDLRDYFADKLANRIRARVRRGGSWSAVAADAVVLLVQHPRAFVRHVVRKAINATRANQGEDSDLARCP